MSGVWLGRPWGAAGATGYVNVVMDGHIQTSGSTDMSGNSLENARFREYNSAGAGANPGARVGCEIWNMFKYGRTLAGPHPNSIQ